MRTVRVSEMMNSSILRVHSLRKVIQNDPEYQRTGEIWNLHRKQLLIDSILNEFDIPKIYFHEFPEPKVLKDGRRMKYAIIDGRQRLEAIWDFLDGQFHLSPNFIYYQDPKVNLKESSYQELGSRYPDIKSIFDSFSLPVINVMTDDVGMIEEMFYRLNESVPLNAAEKRNALGGPIAESIRKISAHRFFQHKAAFTNKRYQFRELSCKLLWLTHSGKNQDTKKVYLDQFVREFKQKNLVAISRSLEIGVTDILSEMWKVFAKRDPLLRTVSMPVIYFLVFKTAKEGGWLKEIARERFLAFEDARRANRKIAQSDISKANYDLLEFDRMSQQGTNDAMSIVFRVNTLINFLRNRPDQSTGIPVQTQLVAQMV